MKITTVKLWSYYKDEDSREFRLLILPVKGYSSIKKVLRGYFTRALFGFEIKDKVFTTHFFYFLTRQSIEDHSNRFSAKSHVRQGIKKTCDEYDISKKKYRKLVKQGKKEKREKRERRR